MEHIKSYKLDYPMRYNRDILNGPLIMEKIYEITNGDAIITINLLKLVFCQEEMQLYLQM